MVSMCIINFTHQEDSVVISGVRRKFSSLFEVIMSFRDIKA